MYRFQPYGNAIINSVQIGRDILVVGGNAILVGYYRCVHISEAKPGPPA